MQYELKCSCNHNAAHHDKQGGYGCYECDCLSSLEAAYREEIQKLNNKILHYRNKSDEAYKLFGAAMKCLPDALRQIIADMLKTQRNLRRKNT